MNFALQKTLELLLIIALGLMLQRKVAKADLKGVKTIILSIALPAVIFISLLKINLDISLLVFPAIALTFNLLMLAASNYFLSRSLPKEDGAKRRTLNMLLPSLAPGLSCFPFIMVYLDDKMLALASLADVGNKIFGLILLYLLAMHWYRIRALTKENESSKSKLKSLVMSLLNEPINMVIIVGLIMLGFGLNLESFPVFIQNTISSLKVLMTPLVLLFIGMAVRIKRKEFGIIFSVLLGRAGIAFLLSSLCIFLIPSLSVPLILLIVVFPQSSCSFWPYAHMSVVSALENKDGQPKPTFDIDFAITVLACSLPFSTILIITIFSFSNYFVDPTHIMFIGSVTLLASFTPRIFTFFKSRFLDLKGVDSNGLSNLNSETSQNGE